MHNLILIDSFIDNGVDSLRVQVFGCDTIIHTHIFSKATYSLDYTSVAALIKAKPGTGPILFRSPIENTIISI